MLTPPRRSTARTLTVLRVAAAGALLAALAPSASASSNGVVISEFRFTGPSGGNDEFVELRNTSTTAVDISGWRLQGCAAASGAPSDRTSVPAGTSLPAGGHYLFTNTAAAGYSGAVAGDSTYTTGLSATGGVRIVAADGIPVDGVGSSDGATDLCRESVGLAMLGTAGDQTYRRLGGEVTDTDDNLADFAGPLAADPQNLGGGTPPPPTVTAIHDIQGAGTSSPLVGQTRTIRAVVTGWDDEIGANFERTFPGDAGLYVQEEAADADADPATSEGIFVGFVRPRTDYPIGTVVELQGRVVEQFGFTSLNLLPGATPTKLGTAGVPDAVEIDTAQAGAQDPATRPYYESLEGMRVTLPVAVANSGGTNKFGELFLTPGATRDRVFRTEQVPSLIATMDDAGAGDPDNPYKPAAPSTTLVRADLFDEVRDATGPLNFSFSNYKIVVQPGALPAVVKGSTPFPYLLEAQAARQLRVVSFNVENVLPVGAELDLGTVTPADYAEKRDRLVDAIGRLLGRPDVIGLVEIGDQATLDDLAAHLGGYTGTLVEGNDGRGIDVAYLIRDGVTATNVRQFGKDATAPEGLSCSDVAGGLFDRPPLAVDIAARGLTFTAFMNHFSSKAAPDACRNAQAAFVRDRVAEVEAAGGEAVVMGDLNAFEDESPLAVLEGDGTSLDNLWDVAPAEERYSFQFNGRLQTLDHVLVTEGLVPRVVDVRYAHIDNDYYRRPPNDGHAASDHDPVVVTFEAPDTTGPMATITSPADGATYVVGQAVAADYACTDEAGGSGIQSCTGPVADGAAVDTSTVGTRTFSVTVRDTAGNETTATSTFRVVYRFEGFYGLRPPPALNRARAGDTLGLAFSLARGGGRNPLAGTPTSRPIDCETGAPTGAETPAKGGLVAYRGYYAYLWRTDRSDRGTCRELTLRLDDGSEHRVRFRLR